MAGESQERDGQHYGTASYGKALKALSDKEKEDVTKRRGSVDNKKRLAAFGSGREEGSADWGSCNPKKLQAVIVLITSLGGATTIGLSRDGGAHSITLLLDGERETLWFNGNADLDEELDNVLGKLEALE